VRGSSDGPPALSSDGTFHIHDSQRAHGEHTFEEIAAAQHGDISLAVVVPQDRVQPKKVYVDTAEEAFDVLRGD
jgi:hypothetical protein